MDKLRITYLILTSVIISFFCSCTKEPDIVPQGNVSNFVLGTKADAAPGTTFRIMAYSAQEDNKYDYVASGTYSLQGKELDGYPYLTASKLDNYGNIIENIDPSQALSVPYSQIGSEFLVAYVSPGIIHNEDGSFTVDRNTEFYCSDVQETLLNNYGKVEMTNELVDRRAKFGFRFYKDNEDKTVEIKDLEITSSGKVYFPATKIVSTENSTPIQFTLVEAQENQDNLVYTCEDEEMEFVLSGIYTPQLKFKLAVNGGGFMDMSVPIEGKIAEILPLTTYIFKITVSNTYIHTILEVTPLNSWEELEFGFDIEDDTQDIDLGIQTFGWENVDWEDNKEIN